MLLLLIRHADAGERDPQRWPDDSDRPLTDKGRKTQRRVSRWLSEHTQVPTIVLTSPWARAAESAQILVDESKLPRPPIPTEALAAPPDLIRLADHIGDPDPSAIVALVGHSPWIEVLAVLLLAGSGTGFRIDFPKSGVMGLDLERVEPAAGELRFFVRPKMV